MSTSTILQLLRSWEITSFCTVSLIHHLKNQFSTSYPKCIRWSTEPKSRWLTPDSRIQNYDLLFFSYQGKDLSVNIKWEMKTLANKQISACVQRATQNQIAIELPLGFGKMIENPMDFQMEIKTLVNILFTLMGLKKNPTMMFP